MRTPLCLVTCLLAVAAWSGDAPRPAVEPGDVVFMYTPRDPEQYTLYQGTAVSWAGRPSTRDPENVRHFRERVEEAHTRGVKYCASLDTLVDFAGYIDFRPDTFMDAVCRDLDGQPLQVPWLWDHKHKGHPSYWFCTNNPEYQKYMADQVERACTAEIDGLHIDDYAGTSHCSEFNGGCFCPSCTEGFRDYLKDRFGREELEKRGIASVADFDYGAFLKSKGVTAESYKREHHKVPLIDEFQTYQNACMKVNNQRLFEQAEAIRGKALLRSINSNASGPRTLIPAPIIDYFCGEVGHDAASVRAPFEPVFVFKTVEGLRRRQAATASGQDWAWIKAHEKPGLVRLWIAQAYAFGSVFKVPHHQWCYTQELGTHWWDGKPEDFTYLYQFVRENKNLLNGYVSLADTALLYTAEDYSKVTRAAEELTEANIPYAVVIQPDEERILPDGAPSAADFERILTVDRSAASAPNRIAWQGVEALPDELKSLVKVEGAGNIRVSLRCNPRNPAAPIACHVLNQNYEAGGDAVQPVTVKITLNKKFLQKVRPDLPAGSVPVHQPRVETAECKIEDGENTLSVSVDVGLWAIVEI